MNITRSTRLRHRSQPGFGPPPGPRTRWPGAPRSTPGPVTPTRWTCRAPKASALDITDPASVAAAADIAGDVTLLINNAGSSTGADLLAR